MVIIMLAIYANFLHDKPYIDQQNKQAQEQNTNLTPQQMIDNAKQAVKDITAPMQAQTPSLPRLNSSIP